MLSASGAGPVRGFRPAPGRAPPRFGFGVIVKLANGNEFYALTHSRLNADQMSNSSDAIRFSVLGEEYTFYLCRQYLFHTFFNVLLFVA